MPNSPECNRSAYTRRPAAVISIWLLFIVASLAFIASTAAAQRATAPNPQRDTLRDIVGGILDGAVPVTDPSNTRVSFTAMGVASRDHGRYVVWQDAKDRAMPLADVGQSVALLESETAPIVRTVVARTLFRLTDCETKNPDRRWVYLLGGAADTTSSYLLAVALPVPTPKTKPRVKHGENGSVATWGRHRWVLKQQVGGGCD